MDASLERQQQAAGFCSNEKLELDWYPICSSFANCSSSGEIPQGQKKNPIWWFHFWNTKYFRLTQMLNTPNLFTINMRLKRFCQFPHSSRLLAHFTLPEQKSRWIRVAAWAKRSSSICKPSIFFSFQIDSFILVSVKPSSTYQWNSFECSWWSDARQR